MSSFTDAITVKAIPYQARPRTWLPPTWQAHNWVLDRGFSYAVGDLEHPSELINVPAGFVFNGHSVPIALLWLFPRAHPIYLQAAALHDWLYSDVNWGGTRRQADAIYFEALQILTVPKFWSWLMWAAVRVGGWKSWRKKFSRNKVNPPKAR